MGVGIVKAPTVATTTVVTCPANTRIEDNSKTLLSNDDLAVAWRGVCRFLLRGEFVDMILTSTSVKLAAGLLLGQAVLLLCCVVTRSLYLCASLFHPMRFVAALPCSAVMYSSVLPRACVLL